MTAALAGCSVFTDFGGLDDPEPAPAAGQGSDASPSTAPVDAGVRDAPREDAGGSGADAAPGCKLTGTVETLKKTAGQSVELARGTGALPWVGAANARGGDQLYASNELDRLQVTRWLLVKGFDLTVPASSVVRGMTVNVRRRADAPGEAVDDAVALVRAGTPSTKTKSLTPAWGTVLTTVSYGGETDTWGETWTPADVSSADFGVAIAVRGTEDALSVEVFVDEIALTLHVEHCAP